MKVRDIALIGVFTALLIGGQLALSAVSGVEVVTVLFLSFAYHFGVRRSLLVANAFSLLRCLIFGFFPTVIILYLVYYNLFAVIFGLVGRLLGGKMNVKIHVLLIILAVILTACFTLIDNVITPLFYGFSPETAQGYFIASLTTMIPQIICAFATTLLLLRPLILAYRRIKFARAFP